VVARVLARREQRVHVVGIDGVDLADRSRQLEPEFLSRRDPDVLDQRRENRELIVHGLL
jgi:hypothetical protein